MLTDLLILNRRGQDSVRYWSLSTSLTIIRGQIYIHWSLIYLVLERVCIRGWLSALLNLLGHELRNRDEPGPKVI